MAKFKIERVIHNCADCVWSKQFVEENGNTEFLLICNWFNNQPEAVAEEDKAFIIEVTNINEKTKKPVYNIKFSEKVWDALYPKGKEMSQLVSDIKANGLNISNATDFGIPH